VREVRPKPPVDVAQGGPQLVERPDATYTAQDVVENIDSSRIVALASLRATSLIVAASAIA
jgi:hypothetical protein